MFQGQESPAPYPPDDPVLAVALAMFIQDGWIDVRKLGTEAGVSRATLYRRYVDRDRILGEVVWSQASADLVALRARYRGKGADGIAQTVDGLLRLSAERSSMRTFLTEHTDVALRVLTSQHGVVQRRFIGSVAEWITEEIGAPADIDTETLAYAVVRLGESFYYREYITGESGGLDAAAVIIGRLLR
ncbi:QsdR family transcriptional regulator [Nocardia altamirensis]|uniref:QsdR family transcriptional regulator n=1 Tax=Nocardia altamirensis TaxID=472158 RepID=UPI000A00CF0A|nr:QsdR family transcriptional regulator [Nocardia altamirensis]